MPDFNTMELMVVVASRILAAEVVTILDGVCDAKRRAIEVSISVFSKAFMTASVSVVSAALIAVDRINRTAS